MGIPNLCLEGKLPDDEVSDLFRSLRLERRRLGCIDEGSKKLKGNHGEGIPFSQYRDGG